MSSRSLLLSSCSPSERMMKREFHLYLYNIDGGRTMVSHRTRRREGNGGQRRKRPTAEEEDLPSASAPLRKGGASSLVTRGTGEGAWWRGQRGANPSTTGPPLAEVRRQLLVVPEARGAARARVRNRPGLGRKKEAGGFACLAGFGSALPRCAGPASHLGVSCRR